MDSICGASRPRQRGARWLARPAAALALLLALGVPVPAAAAAQPVAPPLPADVRYGDFARAAADLAALHVMAGFPDGGFHPWWTIDRASATVVALRLAGIAPQADVPVPPFSDVPAGHWAAGYLAAARGAGIAAGFPDGSFRPGDPVTYAQFVALLARAGGQAVSGPWPDGYTAWAVAHHLVAGTEYAALAPLPRGDAALMADAALPLAGLVAPDPLAADLAVARSLLAGPEPPAYVAPEAAAARGPAERFYWATRGYARWLYGQTRGLPGWFVDGLAAALAADGVAQRFPQVAPALGWQAYADAVGWSGSAAWGPESAALAIQAGPTSAGGQRIAADMAADIAFAAAWQQESGGAPPSAPPAVPQPTPAITVVRSGDEIFLLCSGFHPGAALTLTVDGLLKLPLGVERYLVLEAPDVPPTTHTVAAQDDAGGSATASYTLAPPAGAPTSLAIVPSPDRSYAVAFVYGFQPGEHVHLSWSPAEAPVDLSTDAAGFAETLILPRGWPAGTYIATASGDSGDSASAELDQLAGAP